MSLPDIPWEPFSRDQTEVIKIWLAIAGAALALATWAWHRWLAPRADALAARSRRALGVTLAVLAITGVLNYSRFHPTYVWVERVDAYDLCHYYLNAKYFDELGYFELYNAIVLADIEEGGPHFKRQTPNFQSQNEDDYYFVDYARFDRNTAEHARIRALFGPERWAAFKHDFIFLQRETVGFTTRTWNQMMWDHGFNGSPAWVSFAQPMANAVPVEWVKLLGYVDLAWLLAAVAATWWAFGPTGAGYLVLFLAVSYSTRWPTVTWAFGRYDYVSLLIIGVALLKKRRPLLSGVAVGVAATFRIFPAVWLYGPGMKGVWELLTRRRANRGLLALALGFALGVGAMEATAAARLGPTAIEHHFENLFAHTTPENLSSMRQGFAIAMAYKGETDTRRMDERRRMRVKLQKSWRTPLAVGLVLLLGWALRRSKDHEAMAMGFIPFFLLATASYYYYVVRGTLVVVHADALDKGRNALGLAALFGIEAAINGLQQHPTTAEYRVIHMGWMGWLLTAYSVGMIAAIVWASLREEPEPEAATA